MGVASLPHGGGKPSTWGGKSSGWGWQAFLICKQEHCFLKKKLEHCFLKKITSPPSPCWLECVLCRELVFSCKYKKMLFLYLQENTSSLHKTLFLYLQENTSSPHKTPSILQDGQSFCVSGACRGLSVPPQHSEAFRHPKP